jgi:hypothetical protein
MLDMRLAEGTAADQLAEVEGRPIERVVAGADGGVAQRRQLGVERLLRVGCGVATGRGRWCGGRLFLRDQRQQPSRRLGEGTLRRRALPNVDGTGGMQ